MEYPMTKQWHWRIVFFCSLLLAPSFCNASLELGIAWLKQQQQEDGSFYTDRTLSTPYQATSEALYTLSLTSSLNSDDAASAVSYLDNQLMNHVEYLSRRVQLGEILNHENLPLLLSSLQRHRNSKGGFGDYIGYESSLRGTAFALLSVDRSDNPSDTNMQQDINFLLDAQRHDGSWGEQENISSVSLSAWVSRALQSQRFNYNVGNEIVNATQYLLGLQQSPDVALSDLDIALVLLATIPMTVDAMSYQSFLSRLKAMQQLNGSWGGDVFTTALAVQVLYRINTVSVPDSPNVGLLSGRLVDGVTGLPLGRIHIDITGPHEISLVTDDSGYFIKPDLSPGSYAVSYHANGYQRITDTVNISAGQRNDLGVITLLPLQDAALLAGRITDASSELPIFGVRVSIAGSSDVQVVTDQYGRYQIEINPGAFTVSVDHSGYHTITVSGDAISGTHINFSPALQEKSDTLPQTILVRGSVQDADTNQPLSNTSIRLADHSLAVLTNAQGEFVFDGLEAGNIGLIVEHSGYQSIAFNGVAAPGSKIDVGILRLIPELAVQTIVSGVVTDVDTGAVIPGATIQAAGKSATADASGRYQITDVASLEFGISATATGYLGADTWVSLAQPAIIEINIPLRNAIKGGVSIERFSSEYSTYSAYSEVVLTSEIRNSRQESQAVIGQVQMFDPNGRMIDEFMVSTLQHGGIEEIVVAEDEQNSVSFSWFTQSYPPGDYRFLLSIYSAQTAQLLDQKEYLITITPTAAIASLRIFSSLNHTAQGAREAIDIQVAVRNQSNVPISFDAFYEMRSPDGVVLFSNNVLISLDPQELLVTRHLDAIEHTFVASGVYPLVISADNHYPVMLNQGGEITAAPDIQVNVLQEMTPTRTAPSSEERVKVRIRLEGVEAQ